MRLIDADTLTKQLEEMAENEWNKTVGSSKGLEDAIDVIESMPTVKLRGKLTCLTCQGCGFSDTCDHEK